MTQTAPVATLTIGLLLAWEIAPHIFGVPVYVFPPFSAVLFEFGRSCQLIAVNTWTTFQEALLGCFLGCLVGVLIGGTMARWTSLALALEPYLVASNAIPIVAVSPLVILWFGHGLLSKVVVAAFLCFFPICMNTYRGLVAYERTYSELFDVLGATKLEFFLKYQIPNAIPSILSGLRVSATLAVIGAVVAEFVSADSGLGFGMLQASYALNTPRLYAYLIASCGLGLLMYGGVLVVESFAKPKA